MFPVASKVCGLPPPGSCACQQLDVTIACIRGFLTILASMDTYRCCSLMSIKLRDGVLTAALLTWA
jgi:hypothetical protein